MPAIKKRAKKICFSTFVSYYRCIKRGIYCYYSVQIFERFLVEMKIRWSRLKDSDCLRTKNRLKILSIWQNLCNTSAYTRKLLIYSPPPQNLVICASSNKASWRISNINSFSVVSRLILPDSQTYWNCSANPLSLVLAPVTWRTFSFSTIESRIWELVRDDNHATRTINPEAVRVNKLLTRRSWSALTK